MDPDRKGVTIEDFKELLVEKDYSEFEAEDPLFEEKFERVIYVLRQTILKNKIDIDKEKVFEKFKRENEDKISKFLKVLDPKFMMKRKSIFFREWMWECRILDKRKVFNWTFRIRINIYLYIIFFNFLRRNNNFFVGFVKINWTFKTNFFHTAFICN